MAQRSKFIGAPSRNEFWAPQEYGGPLAVEGVKCFPLQGEVANAQHLTIGALKNSKAHELLRGLHRCLGDISRIEIL